MPLWKLTLKKIMESYFLENVVLCVQFFSGRDYLSRRVETTYGSRLPIRTGRDYLSRRVETTYPGGSRLPIQTGWDYLSSRVETTYPDGSRLPIQTGRDYLSRRSRHPYNFEHADHCCLRLHDVNHVPNKNVWARGPKFKGTVPKTLVV